MNPLTFFLMLPLHTLPPGYMDNPHSLVAHVVRQAGYTETPEELATRWSVWGVTLLDFLAIVQTPINEQAG